MHSNSHPKSVPDHKPIFQSRQSQANPRYGDYAPLWVKCYSFDPFTDIEYVNRHASPFYQTSPKWSRTPSKFGLLELSEVFEDKPVDVSTAEELDYNSWILELTKEIVPK